SAVGRFGRHQSSSAAALNPVIHLAADVVEHVVLSVAAESLHLVEDVRSAGDRLRPAGLPGEFGRSFAVDHTGDIVFEIDDVDGRQGAVALADQAEGAAVQVAATP